MPPGQRYLCRVCGSDRTSYLCSTPAKLRTTATIDHCRCEACGSVFIGTAVNPDDLAEAYARLPSDSYYAEIERENRKKMERSIDDLAAVVPRSASIIDLGTGNGQFVKLLHDRGFTSVHAHEIPGSNLSAIRGIASGIYEDFDYATIPSGAFDVVTLLDVIEHVIDPQFLARACGRILKPGGLVYLHTPVVTRTDRLIHRFHRTPMLKGVGTVWQRGRTSVMHLSNYTPRSLTWLLERAGFGEVTVRVENELSWPVRRYVRIFFLGRFGLPASLAPALAFVLYPLLATDLFNANKGIACGRKLPTSA